MQKTHKLNATYKELYLKNIYEYLFEHNLQASSKSFPYIAEAILYAINYPSCSLDSILNRLALTHGEPAQKIHECMRYSINVYGKSTPKAFIFNSAALLRTSIEKELLEEDSMLALSSSY